MGVLMQEFARRISERVEGTLRESTVLSAMWSRRIFTTADREAIKNLDTIRNQQKFIEILATIDDDRADDFVTIVEEKAGDGRRSLVDHMRGVLADLRRKFCQSPVNQTPEPPSPTQPSPSARTSGDEGGAQHAATAGSDTSSTERPNSYGSISKGHVLIINNLTFPDRDDRDGSIEDVENLEELFEEFKWKPTTRTDIKHEYFQGTLDKFKAKCVKACADACVIVIMSHRGRRGIATSDNQVLKIEDDVLDKFNNENFPEMVGKPKIFIFQFCRDPKMDEGAIVEDKDDDEVDEMVDDGPPEGAAGPGVIHHVGEEDDGRVPVWSDMLICFSTVEDHKSRRNAATGAWYIETLCQVFRKHAKELDICKMLNKVAEKMSEKEGQRRVQKGEKVAMIPAKQMCEYLNRGFVRKFNFI